MYHRTILSTVLYSYYPCYPASCILCHLLYCTVYTPVIHHHTYHLQYTVYYTVQLIPLLPRISCTIALYCLLYCTVITLVIQHHAYYAVYCTVQSIPLSTIISPTTCTVQSIPLLTSISPATCTILSTVLHISYPCHPSSHLPPTIYCLLYCTVNTPVTQNLMYHRTILSTVLYSYYPCYPASCILCCLLYCTVYTPVNHHLTYHLYCTVYTPVTQHLTYHLYCTVNCTVQSTLPWRLWLQTIASKSTCGGSVASPGKPTRRSVTTMGSNNLVVGEDHMFGPSCQLYYWQTGMCGSIAFGSSPMRGKTDFKHPQKYPHVEKTSGENLEE